jgi:DNA polymerase-3 subunit delta'
MHMDSIDLCFSNLLGQDKAKRLLREAVARQKMAHAYLFRGPDGVGKKRAALTLAAYINCRTPAQEDACGRCPSCRKYLSGNHPDLSLVQPDGAAIKINQIRELKHQLVFPPLEAKYRVVVIEDVHTMRREAANSLLKTLEEPEENNLLILTADQAGEILPTILSRCQIVPFAPLPYGQIADILKQAGDLDDSTAITLAAVAEGSLGRAQLLLKENLLDFRKEVVEQILVLQHGQSEAVETVFRLVEKSNGLKENIYELLALLRLWFRDLILIAAGEPDSSIINQDLLASLPAAKQRWRTAQLYDRLRFIEKAEKELLRNCSRTLVCEVLFFDLL